MGWPGPVTHRQYLLWQIWLDLQWDRPTLSDYYLMQIAAEVKRVLSKSPNKIKLKDFLLKFGNQREKVQETPEQAAAKSKAAWVGWVSGVWNAMKSRNAQIKSDSEITP